MAAAQPEIAEGSTIRGARRILPSMFANQSSYGIETSQKREAMPQIPTAFTSVGLIVGDRDFATRLCMAGLLHAETETDIGLLVLSAVIGGSKVDTSFLEKKNIGGHVKFKEWSDWIKKAWLFAANADVKGKGKADEEEGNQDENDSTEVPFLSREIQKDYETMISALPEWFRALDVPAEDAFRALTLPEHEVAGYAGVLVYAFAKQPTPENQAAFNKNRAPMVMSYMAKTDAMDVFVESSKYLDIDKLQEIHRSMNNFIPDRSLLVSRLSDAVSIPRGGATNVFYNMFRLSAHTGLASLMVCTRFLRQFSWLYPEMRELETEIYALAAAMNRFNDVPESFRPYVKVAFGNLYVPVSGDDIRQLFGLAVAVLGRNEPTLERLRGGKVPAMLKDRIFQKLGVVEAQTATEENEE